MKYNKTIFPFYTSSQSILPTIMRALLGFCILTTCATINVSAAGTVSDNVKVQASSDLRIAVLDVSRPGPDRAGVHKAFAASLGQSMSKQCGGPVGVQVTEVDAMRLGFDLAAGVYDAALVIGETVPSVLRKGNFEIVRAISDVGSPARIFHMVIPTEDPSLQKIIVASIPDTLSNPKFQEAVTRAVAIHVNADAIKKAAKESVADTTR